MTKINYLLKGIIIFMVLPNFFTIHDTFAHEDHEHDHDTISIERSTLVQLQSVILAYKDIYCQLTDGNLKGIDVFAQRMADAALRGSRTEPNKSVGRHMMLHILQSAEILKKSENLDDAQDAFLSISKTLAPFFKSWPNQLKNFELKLYHCKENGYHWLQPQYLSPTYPYSSNCSEIEKVIN